MKLYEDNIFVDFLDVSGEIKVHDPNLFYVLDI